MQRTGGMIGEVMPWSGTYVPEGWLLCDGASYSTTKFPKLFEVIGQAYGGSGSQFAVPDLRGRMVLGASGQGRGKTGGAEVVALTVDQMPRHTHALRTGTGGDAPSAAGNFWSTESLASGQGSAGALLETAVDASGEGAAHDNMPPFLAMQWLIRASEELMDSNFAYYGEIRMFAGSQPPAGWLPCHGQRLETEANAALFMTLQPAFAANATHFNLPDLRARFVMGSSERQDHAKLGRRGGAATIALEARHVPWHSHPIKASSDPGGSGASGKVPAGSAGAPAWSGHPTSTTEGPIQPAGKSAPHENMPPYLTLDYLICIDGLLAVRP